MFYNKDKKIMEIKEIVQERFLLYLNPDENATKEQFIDDILKDILKRYPKKKHNLFLDYQKDSLSAVVIFDLGGLQDNKYQFVPC